MGNLALLYPPLALKAIKGKEGIEILLCFSVPGKTLWSSDSRRSLTGRYWIGPKKLNARKRIWQNDNSCCHRLPGRECATPPHSWSSMPIRCLPRSPIVPTHDPQQDWHKMSGLIEIRSLSEWQSLLSSTSVVIADCASLALSLEQTK